jgi:organic radical activating enzyme
LSTVEVSEIFYSLEGEHVEAGVPTVYIRFARCNKKCPLWNNTQDGINTTGYADLGFDPKDYNSLKDLPVITRGCDSQYSVNPKFSHIWKKYEADELLEAVLDLLPGKSWLNPRTSLPVILSLTGGEPTLKMKWIVNELLKSPLIEGCKHILFETNCSVPLRTEDITLLYEWIDENDCRLSWVNSPKLSDSGEPWKRSIMPAVALQQRNHKAFAWHGNQGFNFVVGCYDDLFEVEKAMNEYYAAGIPETVAVSLMPEACTAEQQDKIARDIAQLCMDYGYRFSIRLQSVLWKNLPGT